MENDDDDQRRADDLAAGDGVAARGGGQCNVPGLCEAVPGAGAGCGGCGGDGNLSVHKVSGVREATKAAGAKLVYLPPYSPDCNPTEDMWSKVKNYLRPAVARTVEELGTAIEAAYARITAQDCRGYFKNRGYHAT